MTAPLLQTALAYHHAGLVVLPNDPVKKFPAGLKGWQTIQPTEQQVRAWFANGHYAIGVRDVEGLDFDNKGNPDADTLYQSWVGLVTAFAPGLAQRLLCERTPSGGYHLVWRCSEIAGNQKLATRPPTEDEVKDAPKLTSVTLIETRGKGGQFQVAPSPGYVLERGDWTRLPEITPAERAILLDCARALSRADRRTIDTSGTHGGGRPGDWYNEHKADETLPILEHAGWTVVSARGDVTYLRRPGKTDGISATYGYVAPGVLYVFSSNASPFEPNKAYNPFAVFTLLQQNGDYKAAARAIGALMDQHKPRINTVTGEIIEPGTKPIYVVDWRRQGVTAAELYRTQFDPLNWTVENILPEGAALLAGKPKSRKSWAALAVAVACATGDPVFGRLAARRGRVLFLDLESNQRRMRGRLFSMVGHRMKDIDNLHIYTEWPRGEEGIAALEDWMDAYPDTVLVVIDVLADFRRSKDPKEDAYLYDRETIVPINQFAERRRITALLLHHTRKAKADDVFDEVSGSTGLVSAVATTWILGRAPNGSSETILTPRGRDLINDEPLALEWDDYHNTFVIVGGAVDALQSGERRAILQVMADDNEWTPKEIAIEMGKPVTNVQQLLKALLSEGLVERTGRGKYVRVLGQDQNDQNHHFDQNHQNDQQLILIDQNQDQNQDQNHSPHTDAVEQGKSDDSDHSDPSLKNDHFWRNVPPSQRTILRLHLRSNKESDHERARELCEQYGLDYEQAKAKANER